MKQMAFMIATTLLGTFGVFLLQPFYGIFVYYWFAILRPQYMWYWSLPPGISWSYYVALATLLGALLCLAGVLRVDPRPADEFRPPHRLWWAHYVVLGFAAWIGVTYLTALSREAADKWMVEYVKIFLMYGVAAYLIRTVKQIWALFFMVALTLSYIAYEINYLYVFNHYLGIYHTGYGGLDNNGAGLMLAMGAPLCWYAFEGLGGKWPGDWAWLLRWGRWAFLAFIPVIVHAVLLTYSRGAMLSLIVVCPWLLLRSRHKVQLSVALGCFVLLALPMLAGPEIKARFMTIEKSEIDESANERRAAWKAGWRIGLQYPLFGVGVRNANLISHLYGADREGRTLHSQYFQVLADNGFPGLALYLLMWVGAAVGLVQVRRSVRGRDDPEARLTRACGSGLECSLFLYAFGSFFLSLEVFELPYLLLLLCVQLAVVSGARNPQWHPGPAYAGPGFPTYTVAGDGVLTADPAGQILAR